MSTSNDSASSRNDLSYKTRIPCLTAAHDVPYVDGPSPRQSGHVSHPDRDAASFSLQRPTPCSGSITSINGTSDCPRDRGSSLTDPIPVPSIRDHRPSSVTYKFPSSTLLQELEVEKQTTILPSLGSSPLPPLPPRPKQDTLLPSISLERETWLARRSQQMDDIARLVTHLQSARFKGKALGEALCLVYEWVRTSTMSLRDTIDFLDALDWDVMHLQEILEEGEEDEDADVTSEGTEAIESDEDSSFEDVDGYTSTELLTDEDEEYVPEITIHQYHDDEVDPVYTDPTSHLFGSLTTEDAVPPESTWHEGPEQRRAGIAMIWRNKTAFGNMNKEIFHQIFGCEEVYCPCGA